MFVDVYDSIPAYSTGSTPFKKQCAVILQTKSSSFTLQFIEVQRQNGGGDCTLFAIANTVALCNKQDHHLVRYDQSQMRRHLCECYEGGKLTPFPEKKKPQGMRQRVSCTTENTVYCACWLPHTSGKIHTSGKMIQCHSCKEWFHDVSKPDTVKAFWLTAKKWIFTSCPLKLTAVATPILVSTLVDTKYESSHYNS